ncbi:hypothetical protein [Paucibacter sp. DJ2R-2]|uniref:hypothetical protein n=1 Tax=Paucibacter sp. DJ2R-2 TaxID=2893558 RepID=UPI0021E3AB5C|nr:hypothetical protein [Paucibacter sp. DJ2R-2]MCV2420984.1 hypothetical protein [Paucibacter sp. DJ4R-1]MCV2438962.1 hypothetical protein [Paucibacter sp. DJ2R-2]
MGDIIARKEQARPAAWVQAAGLAWAARRLSFQPAIRPIASDAQALNVHDDAAVVLCPVSGRAAPGRADSDLVGPASWVALTKAAQLAGGLGATDVPALGKVRSLERIPTADCYRPKGAADAFVVDGCFVPKPAKQNLDLALAANRLASHQTTKN